MPYGWQTVTVEKIESKEETASYGHTVAAGSNVKYDLIGKLVKETGLTCKAIIQIVKGIHPSIFGHYNPGWAIDFYCFL